MATDGKPEKPPKIDEQISYNWMFFLLAGAFSAVTVWAIYDEVITRREYKGYQETFFKIERQLTHDRLTNAQKALKDDPEYQAAKKELAQLQGELRGGKRGAFEAAKAEAQKMRFDEFDVRQQFMFTKSKLDEAYYYYTLAKHAHLKNPDQPSSEFTTREKEYNHLLEQLEVDRKKMVAKQAELKEKEGAVKAFTARIDELKAAIEVKEAALQEAERAYAKSKGKLGGLFGSATEIVQVDLKPIDRVDRCESCHMGASRGGFEQLAPEYAMFKSHPFRRTIMRQHPVEDFGCTACHDGQGRATTKFYAHAPSPEEDPHAYHTHYWESPLLKAPVVPTLGGVGVTPGEGKDEGLIYTEAKCRSCHKNEWDLRSEILCESDAECTDAAARSGKKLTCKEAKTYGPLGATIPANAFGTTYPAKPPANPDAKKPEIVKMCVAPSGDAELVDLAPTLSKGLKTIEEAGCFGCHPIEGYENRPKPGPDFRRAYYKFTDTSDALATERLRGWMVNWIMDPKAFRPNTRMPRFFPEILNPKEYPYEKTLDWVAYKNEMEHDAAAMAAYILSASQSEEAARDEFKKYKLEPLPEGGDAERGKLLVMGDDSDKDSKGPGGMKGLGCMACHTYQGKQPPARNRGSHYDNGPDLANVGDKTTEVWLYNWLLDPRRYAPETRMPSLRLSKAEAADIAKFLIGQKTPGASYPMPTDPKTGRPYNLDDADLIKHGEARLKYWGCYGCHSTEKFLTEAGIGVELTEFGIKTSDRLDFGDYNTDHSKQTWDAWTYHKLRHPRVYAYEQANPEKAVFNRMPQFELKDDEIKAIMVVLKGMRGGEKPDQVLGKAQTDRVRQINRGRELVRVYNCYGCHDMDGKRGDLRSQFAGPAKIYGPPTLSYQGFRTQPNWLFDFLKAPFKLRPKPKVRMPTFGFTDDEAQSIVAYFSAIDGAPYPFQDLSAVTMAHDKGPEAGNAHTAMGAAMFVAAECQKCHVQGAAETAPEGAVAPDLTMARVRLRPAWVQQWITRPQAFDPESPMPPIWATSNILGTVLDKGAVQKSRWSEALVGDPDAQLGVLRDYLFNYSKPGFKASVETGPAPAVVKPPTPAQPGTPGPAPRPRPPGAAQPRPGNP